MKRILFIILLTITIVSAILGQTNIYTKTELEILKVNNEFDKAIVARDLDAYRRILSDDFILTSFDGKVTNKAQELEKVKTEDLKFEFGKSDDIRIKVYGKTAIVTGRFTAKGQSKGKDFEFSERYTAVFAKQKGVWKLVAEHSSEIKSN